MIRNIVFDMGNVLLRFDPEWFMTRGGITDSEDRKTITRELFQSVEWAQMDLGVLSEKTAEPLVLARIPERLREPAKNLLNNWAAPREMIPGMEEIVRKLKNAGYGIYLLSNASTGQPAYWNPMPVSRYFDGTLISADVKLIKPQPEFYRLFLETFSLKSEECFFIDDSNYNIEGALNSGMSGAVFYGDIVLLRRALREAGIPVQA